MALVAADDRDELVGISEQGITIRIPANQISSKKAKEDRASSSSVWKRETGSLPSMWFPNRKKMKKIHN